MKTVFILCAESPEFPVHIASINAYAQKEGLPDDTQVWVVCRDAEKPMPLLKELENGHILLLSVRDHFDPQEVADIVRVAFREETPTLLLFEGSLWGDEQAAFAACSTAGTACIGVKRWSWTEESLLVEKAVCSSNLTGTFRLSSPPYCLSLERSSRLKAGQGEQRKDFHEKPCTQIRVISPKEGSTAENAILESRFVPDGSEKDLADAELVMVIGKGAKSKADVEKMAEMAEAMGAQLGVSRGVTMSGWAENHRLIGASGRIIAPRLCLAVGVSGAAAFSIGIENSETIVAINTDPNAPIFRMADMGIVEDYRAVMDTLMELCGGKGGILQ